jgi:cytochrome c-type biogenesis protein CcmH
MRKMMGLLSLCLLLINGFATERYPFSSPKQSAQFDYLIKEMRCMVCSHQNLAESNAPLAMDMKQVIYQQVLNGQSDNDIVLYMTARYGDVILFKPPLKSMTLILWFAPLLLLILAAYLFKKMVYRASSI